ncbi:hypothetical protein E3J59_07010 [Candidatus Aerophobetes bacterium]|uniref:Rubrerythrin diiron-binding domain-containing protein n=1 Tax=Aerophobetes bacterium TaxID=2030807 RepID=A0A523UL95_UNCAE|nr:MAG: hypothetical protein E3J59_07010 [Candidatus Aerophobetes bacterium]
MTEKEKLLLALKSALDLEEDFIVKLVPIYQSLVRFSELSEKEKKYVENILSIMESDSVEHKRIVESLIKKIKMEEKDGYQEDAL